MRIMFESDWQSKPPKRLASFLWVLAITSIFLCPNVNAAKAEVFVVGTLYSRHKTVPTYDLATLRRIILAIKPDVVVLDVNPDELKQEKVHESKIEYSGVIFPLLKSEKYRAYPAEPRQPMFDEIVQSVSKGFEQFEKQNPDKSAVMKQYHKSLYEALKISWQTPADVNGAMTDRVLSGKEAIQERFVREYEVGQRRWNQNTTDMVLRAVKENPNKRILLLYGIDNCYWVRNALRQNKNINLIDIEQWLQVNLK